MARLSFTANLHSHVACPDRELSARTVRELLNAYFDEAAEVRSYVLDDQGALRKHVVVFINGVAARDRTHLSDEVPDDATVCVMQALSGG